MARTKCMGKGVAVQEEDWRKRGNEKVELTSFSFR